MSSDKRGRASAGAVRAAAVASAISLNAMLAGIEREGSRILSRPTWCWQESGEVCSQAEVPVGAGEQGRALLLYNSRGTFETERYCHFRAPCAGCRDGRSPVRCLERVYI